MTCRFHPPHEPLLGVGWGGGAARSVFGAFAIFLGVGFCRGHLCLLFHGGLRETEFGGLQLLCRKMMNLGSSHFSVLVNKLLEHISQRCKLRLGNSLQAYFKASYSGGCYEIAMFC